MSVVIKITGMNKALKRFNGPKFKKNLIKANMKAAEVIERMSKVAAKRMIYDQPISASGYKRTGHLYRSILAYPRWGLKSEVVSGAYYSIYVHEGTRYVKARRYMVEGVRLAEDAIHRVMLKTLDL